MKKYFLIYVNRQYQKVKKNVYSDKLDEKSVLNLPTWKFFLWIVFNFFGTFIYYALLFIVIMFRNNSMLPLIVITIMIIGAVYQIISETIFVQFEVFRLLYQRIKERKNRDYL